MPRQNYFHFVLAIQLKLLVRFQLVLLRWVLSLSVQPQQALPPSV
jgi:hypothetical protein